MNKEIKQGINQACSYRQKKRRKERKTTHTQNVNGKANKSP